MQNQDWKLKYRDLKLKFHDAIDVSFRLGMEQGLQQAQVQQAQQAQASAEAAQNAQMGGQPGEPGQDPDAMDAEQSGSDGSELDQHIGTLEGMLGQSKQGSPEQAGLQKSLDGIKAYQNSIRQKYELKKSERLIAEIGKNMKSPYKISKGADKNMTVPAKKALGMQEQIVADLMKSFEEEEKKAGDAIAKTLNLEQLLKG